jgi:hypothetical protein
MGRGSVISRLTGTGTAAALAALLLWPVAASYDSALWPLLALLGIAGLAGAGVLVLTGIDLLLRPGRGGEVSPVRVFDVLSGAALLGFALLLVQWMGGRLPA